MIKKLFSKKFLYILLLLISLILLGFFNSSDAGYTRVIGPNMGYSPFDQTVDVAVLSKGSVMSNSIGTAKRVFAFMNKIENNGNNGHLLFFWWYNGLPYIYSDLFYNLSSLNPYNNLNQGVPEYYYVCPSALLGTEESMSFSNCSQVTLTENTVVTLHNFFENVVNGDYYYFDYKEYNNYGSPIQSMDICFSSSGVNRTVCFRGGCGINSSYPNCTPLTDSLGIAPYKNFEDINDYYLGEGPGVNNNFVGSGDQTFSTGGTVQIEADINDYISFYESRFGFDEKMCYIGTNTGLNITFGNDIDIVNGTGKTVYELYYYIYGSFGSNRIDNLQRFLNTWYINYTQWYVLPMEDRLYLASYNGPGSDVILRYPSGSSFTVNDNPFSGQRAVLYTYMDYLYSYYTQFNGEQSPGESIAFYCDMKLSYDNYINGSLDFEQLKNSVHPGLVGRIDDYVNGNLRGDGGYSEPGTGSIWDGLILTGYNIPKDLSPTELFKDYYNKINGLVQNFNPANSVGLLPWRIIYPLIFLVLFRILRH